MSKRPMNHSNSKATETPNFTQSNQGHGPANPHEAKNNWLQRTKNVVSSAVRTTAHLIGYAYVPAQSKWFAHGATELANMILHGHPAPVYDSGSVFGSPKESDAQPLQTFAESQPKADEKTKQLNTVEGTAAPKLKESRPEIVPPSAPSESGVEQRMQEIIAMEAAPSKQQQQQLSH